MLGSPCSSNSLSASIVAAAPLMPRGCDSGAATNFACGASEKPAGFSLSAGIQQRGEMLAERLQFGL